ncbi:MAG: thymidine phosphorylase [Clostridia bacterium]|nr:thymidine phosphorylase [Clostridia bacterium]
MRMYDIITKKKHGEALSKEEINAFVEGYTGGDIPDYQASALMMAICLQGMTSEETCALTMAMADSGERLDLSAFGTLTVDKHSTGGVGDKTTLIIAPIAASVGCKLAKMSGRGLGHTGGTVDKLESFPGYDSSLSPEDFFRQVSEVGISVIGQSGNFAPADKKLYALRDVTATVDSIPLITASIMSKKLAAGSHSIVLDVKYGSGSFMKKAEDAEALARGMVEIGKSCGRNIAALITNMDTPLGHAIGNSLEVCEAIEVLSGRGPEDLVTVCKELATTMIRLCLEKSETEARALVDNAIKSGEALETLKKWISAQGGDSSYVSSPDKFRKSTIVHKVLAKEDGYVQHINAEACGIASVTLGAGRITKEDKIDHAAGIILYAKPGMKIMAGEPLAELHTDKKESLPEAEKMLLDAVRIGAVKPETLPIIYKVVG